MRILRGVGSRMLPCGCLVGLYEAYDMKTVALIDARGSGCLDTTHRVDAALNLDVLSPLRDSIGAPRRSESVS
jgi:hypothetical protein